MKLKEGGWVKAIKNANKEPVSLIVQIPGQMKLLRVIQPGEVYGIGQLDPSIVDGLEPET